MGMRSLCAFFVCLLVRSGSSLGQLGSCPADFVSTVDLVASREACTDLCGLDGYCCTTNTGGCGQPTCTAGCQFAAYSATEQECIDECALATGCTYEHAPSGFIFKFCTSSDSCGCPISGQPGYDPDNLWGTSNDCSGTGCAEGCRLAANTTGFSFYGRSLTDAELSAQSNQYDLDSLALEAVFALLHDHITGASVLGTAALSAAAANVTALSKVIKFDTAHVTQALDLVTPTRPARRGPSLSMTGPSRVTSGATGVTRTARCWLCTRR